MRRIASESRRSRCLSRWFGWQRLSHSLDRSRLHFASARYTISRKTIRDSLSESSERAPTAKFRRSSRFNITSWCRCRRCHKNAITSFSSPRVTLKNFQSINKMRVIKRICGDNTAVPQRGCTSILWQLLLAIHRAIRERQSSGLVGEVILGIHCYCTGALVHGPNMDYALETIACRWTSGKKENRNARTPLSELWCMA